MHIDVGDYVILAADRNSHKLARMIDDEKAIICDKYQKDKNKATYVEVKPEDIVTNLGKTPKYGMAYGTQIEWVRRTLEIEPWSDILIYRKLSDEERNKIAKTLQRCANKLEKMGLFPKEKPIEVYIKERKGMIGGTYVHTRKDDIPDHIILKPSDFIDFSGLVYHELAHGIWDQLMGEKLQARWIRAYYKNIELVKKTADTIKKMRKELIEHGTVKAYRSELEDEDEQLFDEIIAIIKKKFKLKARHVNALIANDDDLEAIWPDEIVSLPHKGVLVTDYALTNPDELFAESFRILFDPAIELPKSIQKLMDKTIEICRYGGAAGNKEE